MLPQPLCGGRAQPQASISPWPLPLTLYPLSTSVSNTRYLLGPVDNETFEPLGVSFIFTY